MKWLAYTSNESTTLQVYVQPFNPDSDEQLSGKWQISISGGTQPSWRGDGKELYFMASDRKLMAGDILATRTTFDKGMPHALFESAPTLRRQAQLSTDSFQVPTVNAF
jgi:hypothetical protein